jgi:phosphoglycolate phosphatase-like HAD superfamily hydrolase
MKPVLAIFDLDGTVIDSSKRVTPCLMPNGDLCLATYRKQACTPEAVNTDTLLPLADVMRQFMREGTQVAVCTARHMYNHDYRFLKRHGLRPNVILSRDKLHKHFDAAEAQRLYNSGDSTYKGAYFELLKERFNNHELLMYDDHIGVLAEAQRQGLRALNAVALNTRIETFNAVGFG